jgi:uncharacterized membrane protein YphA (DoxX/SURF4 family)
MRALSLLLLRLTTGALLMIWGFIKIAAPDVAIGVSDKYYQSYLSAKDIQMALGGAEIVLGVLVILGLFRSMVYPLQTLVLGLGLAAIWKYIADPFGMYLLTRETSQVLFFPSTTVFAATLILLAFREYDTLSADEMRGG